ncbi:MAG TPA: hypothetical protein VHK69_02725 [Chitinophagaceae bacterium]|nr:hypothetical protein [Chitinophagaceae bacterium]
MKRGLLMLIGTLITSLCFSQIVMVGPMVHFNFEGKKVRTSWAVEASYWKLGGFPYGFDAAVEYQKGKFRLYTEAQTGIGVAGLSAGPFIEFAKASPVRGGFQMTGWVNYYVGADVRVRFYRGPDVFAAGLYAKVPASIGEELDDDDDDDFDWWDWD